MKKSYSKPSIYIESLQMNTAICSCGPGANSGFWGNKPNTGDPYNCAFVDAGGLPIMFSDAEGSACGTAGIPVDGEGAIYCYQAYSEDMTIFAS